MNAGTAAGRDGPSFPSARLRFGLFGSKVLGRTWVQKGPEWSVHMCRTPPCSIPDGRDPIRTRAKAIDGKCSYFFFSFLFYSN